MSSIIRRQRKQDQERLRVVTMVTPDIHKALKSRSKLYNKSMGMLVDEALRSSMFGGESFQIEGLKADLLALKSEMDTRIDTILSRYMDAAH